MISLLGELEVVKGMIILRAITEKVIIGERFLVEDFHHHLLRCAIHLKLEIGVEKWPSPTLCKPNLITTFETPLPGTI